ncbi:MAG: methyltransferase domain-containing protein [Balneolales bacterium]
MSKGLQSIDTIEPKVNPNSNSANGFNGFFPKRFKSVLRKFWPDALVAKWSGKPYLPATGKINWGDLRRITPLCREFGTYRGGAIDRYYIENFLAGNADIIKGRILEIGDNEYTIRYGKDNVTISDILDINEGNPKATIVADLQEADHIPSDTFDCIILTQTLQFIYDYKAALRTCNRILKPQGSLLLTVPGISQIEEGEMGKNWLWSFTKRSMELIMEETFPQAQYEIETFGNVLSASAFLYGISRLEVSRSELDYNDRLYQVLITLKVTNRG